MPCTCLPDALYIIDRCFGLLNKCVGLFVRCLAGWLTSSCQLVDKEHKANSNHLTETVVYHKCKMSGKYLEKIACFWVHSTIHGYCVIKVG